VFPVEALCPDNKKFICKTFYEVFPAPSAVKFFEILENVTPDLVLLDILMPNMDGWETYNRLKAFSFLQDIPVAFLTSISETTEKDYAIEIGAAVSAGGIGTNG